MTGATKTNLLDVARKAGVSQTTVSRFFNEPEKIREETRKRISRAIAELDFVPSMTARALAMSRSHTIGAIVPTFDHALFSRELSDMADQLSQAGYALLISSGQYEPGQEHDLIRTMIGRNVDGLLLVGLARDPDIYDLLDRRGVPYVTTWTIDREVKRPQVGADKFAAAHEIADHLLDLGHRRFAVVEFPLNNNDRARTRLRGFRTALEARGLSLPDEFVFEGLPTYEAGGRVLRSILDCAAPPTALMCSTDVFAIGALLEARRLGVSIPSEISITGFDNLPISSLLDPPLTTIDLAVRETGQLAARYLLDRIEGKIPPMTSIARHSLILGRSTDSAQGRKSHVFSTS
ncbi:LacI family DNA-binding transcriptional regulator [Meridianimarinicoccus sp. RP-17]|uniref:LacI family DNA-binding transcriptional regulator n=1 Tax=Meridianimarinicoccus zhengii TaxID=2056810 RepID=UPI0013A68E2A|nr:LacI family DNA-binding transcriptional regulator [Phycocomes zhengii]